MLDLIDCTRGLNSLALVDWLGEMGKEGNYFRCFSGYGEPEWIPWGDLLETEIIHLARGWACGRCGNERFLKVRKPCPECSAGEHLQNPKPVKWGGIRDWKEKNQRLTFRFSAHPF